MREFYLKRHVDKSEVSGTGRVAQGVELPSGKVVLEWCTEAIAPSHGIYEDIDHVIEIHGHDGLTTIEWIEEEEVSTRNNTSTYIAAAIGALLGVVAGTAIALILF